MDTITEEEIREMMRHDLIVLYTKDNDVNDMRESEKEKTIDWLIQRFNEGPSMDGTRSQPPPYSYLFGSYLWNVTRKAATIVQPICAICGKAETKEVHHIRPRFLGGSDDPRNLIGVCIECHDEIHKQMDYLLDRSIKEAISNAKYVAQYPNRETAIAVTRG